MTKQAWRQHMKDETGIEWERATNEERHIFRAVHHDHLETGCPECASRERTRRATANRRARSQAMRDLGLVRVHGALGGIYWE